MLVPDPALRGDDNITGTPFSKRGKHTKMDAERDSRPSQVTRKKSRYTEEQIIR
jgi:hypothetical protein